MTNDQIPPQQPQQPQQPPQFHYQQQFQQQPPPPPHPREFPRGFFAGIDFMIMYSGDVMELLRRGEQQQRLTRFFILVAIIMGAIYGAVMGATNLLQGTDMPLNHKLLQIVISAAKVPALFILALIIVLPPIHVSNAFAGAKLRFGRITSLLFGSMAIQLIALASLATVAFFFALTSRSYDFIKLLHVGFFVYPGLVGLRFLIKTFRMNTGEYNKRTPFLLFFGWLLLYGFVGIQLAWTLRPFVGSPNEPFMLFREREGNVIESVLHSLGNVLVPEEFKTLLESPQPPQRE